MVLNSGTGNFTWDDTTGASDPDKPLRVYYYRPNLVTANTPVWIIAHGQSRNADDYRDYFVDAARKQGAIVIAPEFSDSDWSGSEGYNLGNIATSEEPNATPIPKQDWSFSKIEPLFNYVKQLEPNLATNQYFMFGHSAGAQFIHRFLQWTPDARVKLAVSANAGWYTIPDTDGSYAFSWPYSTSNVPDYNPATQAYDPFPVSNVTNVLGDKLVVLLGDEDTERTDSVRQTVEADAQGLNRFERGQFFFDEGQAEAAALGVDFGWDKYIVPGVDHSGSEMAIPAAELFRIANLPATPPTTPAPNWYFSIQNSTTLNGITVANEDIVQVDANGNLIKYFDGSDVNLGGLAIDAFDIISDTEILISFTEPGTVAGISQEVDDSDIVKFTATGLGVNTSGTFDLYFDGSDVRLTADQQDIDAITQLSDGSLLVSTTGGGTVPGIGAQNEDLLRFVFTSTGTATRGAWSQYFDGSDIGLGTTRMEDVDAVSVTADGTIYLSTIGDFSTQGTVGADEDIFTFTPSSTGVNTSGTVAPNLFFDGSVYGLGANDIKGIDLA